MKKENQELKNPYFDLQAEVDITKHMGGFRAMKELAELCRVSQDKYVLDVGCGVGRSSCKIARIYGCSVVGIDLSERMIERAREKAKKGGIENKVKFRVADAQNLHFKDSTFDAVISESVTAFVGDKQKALREYRRVIKPGGYIGLNEVTWRKKPTKEMVEYAYRVMGGLKPENCGTWRRLFEAAGLKDIVVRPYKMAPLSQVINEIMMGGFFDSFKGFGRLFSLYFKSPVYRKAINGMIKDAKSIPKKFLEYYGYGIYVGRK